MTKMTKLEKEAMKWPSTNFVKSLLFLGDVWRVQYCQKQDLTKLEKDQAPYMFFHFS